MTMRAWDIVILIAAAIVGLLMVEIAAISKRASKDVKFSFAYYWKQNGWVIVGNLLGVVGLLMCARLIIALETYAMIKFGGSLDWVPFLIPPTGIIIGYGGGRLVRLLLKKGAAKVGLEDAFVETTTELGEGTVKTTTTVVTPTNPPPEKPDP